MMRLLRPSPIGIFPRSFRSHSTRYAREMIAEIRSMGDALATAIITRTGSITRRRRSFSVARIDAHQLAPRGVSHVKRSSASSNGR